MFFVQQILFVYFATFITSIINRTKIDIVMFSTTTVKVVFSWRRFYYGYTKQIFRLFLRHIYYVFVTKTGCYFKSYKIVKAWWTSLKSYLFQYSFKSMVRESAGGRESYKIFSEVKSSFSNKFPACQRWLGSIPK